jgi:hypothetical protein
VEAVEVIVAKEVAYTGVTMAVVVGVAGGGSGNIATHATVHELYAINKNEAK